MSVDRTGEHVLVSLGSHRGSVVSYGRRTTVSVLVDTNCVLANADFSKVTKELV